MLGLLVVGDLFIDREMIFVVNFFEKLLCVGEGCVICCLN